MDSDETYLRLAIARAHEGRERGGDPFGAVLVLNRRVVHQVYDRCVELSDPTYHAELSLISEYCRANKLFSLEGCTLYASTEPCPMCAGAIHWSRISRVVFSVSQEMLQKLSGGRLNPSLRSILDLWNSKIEVVGPLLPDEGLTAFEAFTFIPKVERHAAKIPRREGR